ncbi:MULTISPECIES: hypothetical protein [Streptosporangium]|uniref:Glycine/serine hydroxymethyltransferase n=1 Tax=Streptosporangium brasiliense TaxID=47480 RepID=A0ABT9RGH3_9ACTN|nr:hypothetical protein [Streptosporangium brasiliense]MDP9867951.1 glycine/serine hydroxymethyltransferase [Streptosporangium brasiliense]
MRPPVGVVVARGLQRRHRRVGAGRLGRDHRQRHRRGLPGGRYRAGCEYVDQVEELAIERAKEAFGARYVNVQPHCASFANHSVMQSLLRPGATVLGMALDQGGHLTHGAPVNLSGRLYTVHTTGSTTGA